MEEIKVRVRAEEKTKLEPKIRFEEHFEKKANELIEKTFEHLESDNKDYILKKSKEKRLEGLKKYGEESFQISFENLIKSSVDDHLEEELIDVINYLAAIIMKKQFEFYSPRTVNKYGTLLIDAVKMMDSVLYKSEEVEGKKE